MRTRLPAVAGMFYPGSADDLGALIDACRERRVPLAVPPPKAVIVPHAGYVYSGPIAATAYAAIAQLKGKVSRVVLLGPSHRFPLRGCAVPECQRWRTPLGDVDLDLAAIDVLANRPGVQRSDAIHQPEHSLEVQVPFLQWALGDFRLVPVVVGELAPARGAELLDAVWGGDETLIVVSSDLSHYHDDRTARRKDAGTTAHIEALKSALDGDDACGCRPVNALLHCARARRLEVRAVDVRNSSQTAGDASRVVGYGSYLFWPRGVDALPARLSQQFQAAGPASNTAADGPRFTVLQRRRLLAMARAAIEQGLATAEQGGLFGGRLPPVVAVGSEPWLTEPAATFVSVHVGGELHGCIGNLEASMPLAQSVARNAWSAAFRDPRSHPLDRAEYRHCTIHVSVLSPMQPLPVADRAELIARLRPGQDGVVVRAGERAGTFLPVVWDDLATPEAFLTALWRKAGFAPGSWPAGLEVHTYSSEAFGSDDADLAGVIGEA